MQPAGAESYTALCTDIPGVAYGTIPNRADGTLLKVIPKSAQPFLRCRQRGQGVGQQRRANPRGGGAGLRHSASRLALSRRSVHLPLNHAVAGIKKKAFEQTAMLAKGAGSVATGATNAVTKSVSIKGGEAAGA